MNRFEADSFLDRRNIIMVAFIVINTYSWFFPLYFLVENVLQQIIIEYEQIVTLFGVFYVSAFLSPFIGVSLINKGFLKRGHLFLIWTYIGSIASIMPLFNFEHWELCYMKAFFLLLGFSFGLGFPSCLAQFADYNNTMEGRGKNAGLLFLVAGPGILMLGMACWILPVVTSFALLATWRFLSFVTLIIGKFEERPRVRTVIPSYKQIITERKFALYFIPWVMCCVVNYFEASLLRSFFGPDFSFFVPLVEFGVAGIIALVSGYISDFVGRKRIVVFGFVILGIGYAFLGLFPYSFVSWYFYIAVDGIAWGIFAVMFFFLLWGELAESQQKEKYYLLGGLPYLILSYIAMVAAPYISTIPVLSTFSLASFFLFLAVIPLMFAPETLPEKVIKEKELRSYIEKAKRLKEKFTEG